MDLAVSSRAATGIPHGKLGMWLFLASEVMFFTGLLGAYIVLRFSHPSWPGPEGHLSVPIGTMNTLFLIGSSVTIVLALAASQAGLSAVPPARAERGEAGGPGTCLPSTHGDRQAAQAGALPRARWWLAVTIALGCLFLTVKGFEYAAKFAHHILPSTNVFWSCYFALTGLHALHVLGGIIFNLWILRRLFQPAIWAGQAQRLEYAGLYWHFVDIVWIFLFPLLYLI